MSAVALATQLLLQDSGVSSRVGDAVFPGEAPQDQALPYIVTRLVSESSNYVLTGTTGAFDARVEVSCHARSFGACDALGEAVKVALSDVLNQPVTYGDDSPPDYMGTVTMWKTATDMSDVSPDRKVFRRVMDFRVRWWRDAD